MNLLFDLDGTLTDPFEGITNCITHALVTLGRPAPRRESLRWCIGPPLKKSLAKLLATNDDQLVEKALVIYRERFSTIGLFETVFVVLRFFGDTARRRNWRQPALTLVRRNRVSWPRY